MEHREQVIKWSTDDLFGEAALRFEVGLGYDIIIDL